MAKARDAVRMTDAEIGAFLGRHRKVQVGTLGRDGFPHLATLYYVLVDGHVAFWTYAASQKIRNLRREPRLTVLVEEGNAYFDLRGVMIKGRADLVTDQDTVRAIGRAVASATAGDRELDGDELRRVHAQASKRCAVIVRPLSVASWDHTKLQ